ncbi:hypothetical protein J2X17_003523 [Flavobacterium aquidurense]|nr:hypothetical protein [Flavobacterium aquidurense]
MKKSQSGKKLLLYVFVAWTLAFITLIAFL